MKRIAIAMLVAPLWVPILLTAYAAAFSSPPDFMESVGHGAWLAMAAGLGAAVGYLAMLLIGLPTHLRLRRRETRSVPVYFATWFAVAIAVWLVAFVAGFARDGLGFAFAYLAETIVQRPHVPLAIGIAWGVVGVTFRAIVGEGRTGLRSRTFA